MSCRILAPPATIGIFMMASLTGQSKPRRSNLWAGVGMIVCFLMATALLISGLTHEKTAQAGTKPPVATIASTH